MQPDVRSSTPVSNFQPLGDELRIQKPRFLLPGLFRFMKKLALILLAFLLVSCQMRVHAPVPTTSVPDGFACRDDVHQAMIRAWGETADGTSGTEAGFRIDRNVHGFVVVPHEHTNERGLLTIVLSLNTVAEFHVHPNDAGGAPSTPENNFSGDRNLGDTKVADAAHIDIYTFNRDGLFVYRWKTKQIIMLRNRYDWLQPCH
jgi:hypothetical protein